jgi:hypothetical protein
MAGPLEDLTSKARRRWRWNLILAQAARAGCAAAGGMIVLLLAGTEVLDWPWLAALAVAGLLYGFRRTARQMPSPYEVAQAVDRNLALHDALSTAYFFSRPEAGRTAAEEMRAAQRAAAETLCPEVDLRRAVPLHAPRAIYLAAALVVAAGGLFALRYGIARRLELSRSLPRIVLDTLRPPVQYQAAKGKRADRRLQEYWQNLGVTLDEKASAGDRLAAAMAEEGQHNRYSPEGVKPLEMSAGEENPEGGEAPGDELALGTGQEQAQPPGAAPRGENRPGDNDSLLEKFRDAFASLLNRLKIQPKGGDGQQVASSAMTQSETAQGRQAPSQRGMPGSGRELSEGQPGSEAQEMQASEGGQKSSNAPGRRGQEGESEASREGRSGIGREEGSKELRAAEQQAAMGKISELIGRRSQTLTGEVMVEVTSGKQQLRTAYSQQQAAHAEAGGDIHRDEIPLAYQSYVERYFEQVRKPPARPQK